jgi:acyl-coenzyme A synthetase/AMP-(fatty) acid ligase
LVPEPVSLWDLTEAAGDLSQRFIADETRSVTLGSLQAGSTLAAPREVFAGVTVLLRAPTQLATALALLELDGVARRIVVCTPDLSAAHLRAAVALADATIVVADRAPPELADGPALTWFAGSVDIIGGMPRGGGAWCETEWALFTSGTTGPPKMALHTLRSLTGAIRGAIRPQAATRPGVWSTFYDIRRYGGLQILLRALVGGGSMVLSGAGAEPAGDFLARAAAAGINFLSGTPTHWRRAVLSPAAAAIAPADVRLSGELADQGILDKLRATYPGARVCHAFASTEAGVAFEVADGLAGFPADWIGQDRNGVELRVDAGTLRIRSARTATRYLGDAAPPLRDAEDFVDTKDLVELRGERYHFAGRRDGVINVGGLKVHPEEVEDVVNRHGLVEMSLVKAKRSPIIGAVVVVDVVLRDGTPAVDPRALEAEILALCRDNLAAYKVPAAVRVVPALAVSPAGKLIRAGA